MLSLCFCLPGKNPSVFSVRIQPGVQPEPSLSAALPFWGICGWVGVLIPLLGVLFNYRKWTLQVPCPHY